MSQRFIVLCIAVFAAGSSGAIAQGFSAEMVHVKPAGSNLITQVNGSGDRLRFAIVGHQKQDVVVIFDLATQVSTMIVPSNQSYMVSTPGWTSPALPLFKISDPENACPDWEKALNKPGTCSKVGDEKLEGRDTVKYRGSSKNGETGYAWVDRKLHLVIKWDGEKRGTELRNIQEGPQSASLFEIPSNYQKVDAKAADQAQRQKQKSARPTAPN